MHTKGKWEIVERNSGIFVQEKNRNRNLVICELLCIGAKDIAKHIVQAHNSFDGLLEACKLGLKYADAENIIDSDYKKTAKLFNNFTSAAKSAIAEAESIE